MLVGEPGVGKTALAEGLALMIMEGKIPKKLSDARVYSLDIGAMLAGARYRGDFEERLKIVVSALQQIHHAILFIDEFHTIVGAGATSGSSLDASNLLKPALANGQLRCMGATTYKEYRQHVEKDKALLRRFQKIDVQEPSYEEAIAILNGIKSEYERFHHITYDQKAIETAVLLSQKYIHDRKLPDKAIDVLDEVGAKIQLHHAQNNHEKSLKPRLIKQKDIEMIIADIARIPMRTLQKDDHKMLSTLKRNLQTLVYGQEQAIQELTDAIIMARTGLRETEKPIGCYLFTGPTGVGKTEVAKQLSYVLGMSLHRFDMSEYMERHAVSRLIGAPPGYVGYEEGGLLTEKISKNPNAILLLDEIEKAHPDVYNILLQLMDNGIVTDSNGNEINCRNIILIMTSNIGSNNMQKHAIGFEQSTNIEAEAYEAVEKSFSPEFRNRLDKIIAFSPLTMNLMEKIVDKFIYQLEGQMEQKHLMFHITKGARAYCAKKGFNPSMGARPLARLIQEEIKQPLSLLLLKHKQHHGANITIALHKNKKSLLIQYKPHPKTEEKSKKLAKIL